MSYSQINKEQLQDNDYIFCGIRLNNKNIKIVEILFYFQGDLKNCHFKYNLKLNKVIGGIYRGSRTEDFKTFTGLEAAKFVQQIKEREVILACHGEEQAAKKELSKINIEKKYKKENPFERDLRNIKAAYDNLRLHTDRAAFIELIINTIKGN